MELFPFSQLGPFGRTAMSQVAMHHHALTTSLYHAPWLWMALPIWVLMLGAGGMLSEQTDRTRDGLAGPVRQTTTTIGGSTTIKTYDRTGALLETHSRVAGDEREGQPQAGRFIYVYDDKQQRLREMSQYQDEAPYLSRQYAYDALGRQQAEAAYHMCGTFASLDVFSYNDEGKLSEQLTYQFRSLGSRMHEYDEQGRIKAVRVFKNGTLQSTIEYRYDGQGRLSEQVEVLPDSVPGNRTTYEYDEGGRLLVEESANGLDSSRNAKSTYGV